MRDLRIRRAVVSKAAVEQLIGSNLIGLKLDPNFNTEAYLSRDKSPPTLSSGISEATHTVVTLEENLSIGQLPP